MVLFGALVRGERAIASGGGGAGGARTCMWQSCRLSGGVHRWWWAACLQRPLGHPGPAFDALQAEWGCGCGWQCVAAALALAQPRPARSITRSGTQYWERLDPAPEGAAAQSGRCEAAWRAQRNAFLERPNAIMTCTCPRRAVRTHLTQQERPWADGKAPSANSSAAAGCEWACKVARPVVLVPATRAGRWARRVPPAAVRCWGACMRHQWVRLSVEIQGL